MNKKAKWEPVQGERSATWQALFSNSDDDVTMRITWNAGTSMWRYTSHSRLYGVLIDAEADTLDAAQQGAEGVVFAAGRYAPFRAHSDTYQILGTEAVAAVIANASPYKIDWITSDDGAAGHTLFYGPTSRGMSHSLLGVERPMWAPVEGVTFGMWRAVVQIDGDDVTLDVWKPEDEDGYRSCGRDRRPRPVPARVLKICNMRALRRGAHTPPFSYARAAIAALIFLSVLYWLRA